MQKDGSRALAKIGAFALAGLFLAGCSIHAQQAKPTSQQPTQLATASATAAIGGSPSPSPAISQTPQATPALPTAAPEPVATFIPKNAPLADDDYFIIDKNWVDICWDRTDDSEGYRYGVVDAYGNVILPFIYTDISSMLFYTDQKSNTSKYHYFFAHEYMRIENNIIVDFGYIYNTTGKRASAARYDWAQRFGDSYLIAKRTNIQRCGIMAPDLHVVVPFTYNNIVDCGGWLAASYKKNGAYWVDFLSGDLKLLGKLQVGGTDISCLDTNLLMARGLNGKLGFIDKSMTWCAKPQWDELIVPHEDNYLGPKYPMWKGNTRYNVNKYGKTFIPQGCDPEYCNPVYGSDEDCNPFLYNGLEVFYFNGGYASEQVLFTETGKVLYRSSSADGFQFEDGVIIDGSKAIDLTGKVLYQTQSGTLSYSNGIFIDNGRAVDKTGKDLLPGVTNVTLWEPNIGLYICGGDSYDKSGSDFYTKDGFRLPLPPGYRYKYLSPDRIAASTGDGQAGICNRRGQWLLYPTNIDFYDWDSDQDDELIFTVGSNGENKYGLLDINGNYVLNPIFEQLTVLSAKRGLYEVLYDGIHGIIDSKGNWIWYNSDPFNLAD